MMSGLRKIKEKESVYAPRNETAQSHDFRVSYRLIGNRPVYQGIKFDFMFHENVDFPKNSLHTIWPEFENSQGAVLVNDVDPVDSHGTARMWIIIDELRERYRRSIKLGARGYFMAGPNKTAECVGIEINM